MKKFFAAVMSLSLIGVSMVILQGCSPLQVRNAGLCGMGGALAGAAIDKRDPLRGAIKGAIGGSVACAAITAMAEEASREAARTGRVVHRQDREGRMVQSTPAEYNAQTKCRKIVNRAWDKGKMVGETVEEVCEGQQVTNRY